MGLPWFEAKRSRDEILEDLKRIMKLKSKDGFKAEVLAEFHFQNFMSGDPSYGVRSQQKWGCCNHGNYGDLFGDMNGQASNMG